MGRSKSVVARMEITQAGSSHNCRFDKRHRVQKGAHRLTIIEGRTKMNYCLGCGVRFLAAGRAQL